ncbi:hypothetical protein GUJ93_ZPchr0640g2855 [Zizania palustris]|uniref:Uncharacterized protein n=1 Tax=Zizania palustris TaxID=103762 RepID=A0A8J5RBA0_ZIZPA|nr:hypothetical protein GUJ93_ZPchr0640g2855 [Zizania palustris]
METAAAQGPPAPVPWQRLDQTMRQQEGCWNERTRCALQLAVFAGVTGSFVGAVYRARHRPRDIAFLAVTYWLIALLVCLVRKLEIIRLDAAAREAERRRVSLAVWAVTVALTNTVAWRVADAMPYLVLKLAVWGVALVVLSLVFYFVFCRKAEQCCNAEHDHVQADAAAGRRPERTFGELSPEEKV